MNLQKQIESLFKLSAEIRGGFLDQAILIERLIDDIISRHFCPIENDRFRLLSSLMTTELNFQSRIKIFKTMLERYYHDLLEKHPDLIKQIDNIRVFRNKIAHSMLDSSADFLKKEYNDRIRLVSYEKGEKKYTVVKKDDIRKRLGACTRVIFALLDVQKEVHPRAKSR